MIFEKKVTRHAQEQRAGQHYLPFGDFSASGTVTYLEFFAKLQVFYRISAFSNFCRWSTPFHPLFTGREGAPSVKVFVPQQLKLTRVSHRL